MSNEGSESDAATDLDARLLALQEDLDGEELSLFRSVLDIEKRKLHMHRPRGVADEIEEEIKRVIK